MTGVGRWLLALVASLALACGGEDETEPTPEVERVETSAKHDLQWKRARVVQRDLMRALELESDEVCLEVGVAPCVEQVHLVALGGHDPFGLGLYESLDAPLKTSPVALDRVALSACGARVELDREAGDDAVVFAALDLEGDAPAADDDAVHALATSLYRRLLARDPLDEEVEILAQLTVDGEGEPVSAADFGALACFAVTTSTEFLLF
jgi:hypothetical protein